jgi:serpin B
MKFALYAAFAATLAASPCRAQDDPEDKADPKEAFVPAEISADQRAIVSGMNRFGFDLYGKLRAEPGDLAFSPASASTAFGMAYAGARGGTAQEIASVLHYAPIGDFHRSFGGLLKTMDVQRNGRTLSVNNALWLQKGLRVLPDYVRLVEQNYGAGLQWVDYRGDREAARQRINSWVEGKTNNRIRGLIQPANLNDDTRSILVNTIYFKADWDKPFDKDATRPGDFHLLSGTKVTRPLMTRRLRVPFVEESGTKSVALPYRGGETEMVFLLPPAAGDLQVLEQSVASGKMDGWLERLSGSRQLVDVTIPKFRIEKRMKLTDPLRDLGLKVAFSNQADFSGVKVVVPTSDNREDWNLKIDDVIQQVFVDVEEKGTEAAAATAIMMAVVTGVRIEPKPKVFRADHPFLFLIRDRRTGVILFMGRYTGGAA